MINKTHFLFLISVLALLTTGCERAVDKSQVSISLPSYSTLSAENCTGTKCLKALIVNVEGSSFSKIVVDKKHSNMSEPGTQINPIITVEVPTGPNRKFQIFAVYREPGGEMSAQFGSTVVDLNSAEPPPVVITLSPPANFKAGSLVGRYLTDSNSGPSGKVNISLKFPNTEQRIQIGTGEILNGWFDFFASENFKMTYTLENGTVLFTDKSLDDFTTSSNVVRMHQPATYFRNMSGWVEEKGQDIVYGFFGSNSTFTDGKSVCLEYTSNPEEFVNVASDSSGSPLMTYSYNNTSADFYGIGGLNSNEHTPCSDTNNSLVAPRYESDRISINQSQLDGNGNDTAKSIAGGFSYIIDQGNQTYKYRSAGNVYKLQTLPGVFYGAKAVFDGIRLYRKPSSGGGGESDNIRCTALGMSEAGYTEETGFVTDYPSIHDPESIIFKLTAAANASSDYTVCPTSQGNLTGLGGFYLNNLSSFSSRAMLKISNAPVKDYGSIPGGTSLILPFYVTNIGTADATYITSSLSSGVHFNYDGGDYPGFGGTCDEELGSGVTCMIKVLFTAPTTTGDYKDSINIYYNDGVITNNLAVRPIKGRSN
jgi:hypothetical protein